MGYLADNISIYKNTVICQDLYLFRIIIAPQFASDLDLQILVKDVIPDVEEWQFSGRRQCPVRPLNGKAKGAVRVVHPAAYAQNSRRARQFTSEVVFAFHTTLQRSQVAARLTNSSFKFRLEDEPISLP